MVNERSKLYQIVPDFPRFHQIHQISPNVTRFHQISPSYQISPTQPVFTWRAFPSMSTQPQVSLSTHWLSYKTCPSGHLQTSCWSGRVQVDTGSGLSHVGMQAGDAAAEHCMHPCGHLHAGDEENTIINHINIDLIQGGSILQHMWIW